MRRHTDSLCCGRQLRSGIVVAHSLAPALSDASGARRRDRRRSRKSRRRRGVAIGSGGSAEAHSFLVRAAPAAGARLERAPAELVRDFSEALVEPPTGTLRAGERATIAALTLAATVRETRPRRPAGARVRGVPGRLACRHRRRSHQRRRVRVRRWRQPARRCDRVHRRRHRLARVAGFALLSGLAVAVGGLHVQRHEHPAPRMAVISGLLRTKLSNYTLL